jgi:PAS domain S-box-containing protein
MAPMSAVPQPFAQLTDRTDSWSAIAARGPRATMMPLPGDDTATADGLAAQYASLLRQCAGGPDEALLHAAHELGRRMLAARLGLLDVVALHTRLVADLLATEHPEPVGSWLETSGQMLLESLTPFEMTHRGFRAANTALKASEERYRDLVENANDAIFTLDLDGRLASINRAGEQLIGYGLDDARHLTLEDIVAPESAALIRRLRAHATERPGERMRHELEIVASDGRLIPVEVSTRGLFDGETLVGLQGIARDITDQRNAETALRHLNHHLEEKAKRIAHALHDEAGQLLASVYLRVAEIADELSPPARRSVEDLRTLLDQVDDQIRRLAHELRPTLLDDLGLVPACQFLAEGVSKRARLKVTVAGSTGGRLHSDVETALYRVAQEALTNVARHARATSATVSFERSGPTLRGCIRDNGVGFDVQAVIQQTGRRGLGLIGMRERLVAVGGRLHVRSAPGEGTSVEFDVPVES